jgi:hypothetical protein
MPGLDTVVGMVADIMVVVDIQGVGMELGMELGGMELGDMELGVMACMVGMEDMVAVTVAACTVEAMGALLLVDITMVVLGVWDPGNRGTRMLQRHHLPGKRC